MDNFNLRKYLTENKLNEFARPVERPSHHYTGGDADLISKLNDKKKEFDTPEGENEYNDGVRRGLALAIVMVRNSQ